MVQYSKNTEHTYISCIEYYKLHLIEVLELRVNLLCVHWSFQQIIY